jgi:hypothetical protein
VLAQCDPGDYVDRVRGGIKPHPHRQSFTGSNLTKPVQPIKGDVK